MSDLAKYRKDLAELCGYQLFKDSEFIYGLLRPGKDPLHAPQSKPWRPDEDVAQAVQCWEAFLNQERAGWDSYICCAEIRWPIAEGIEIAIRRDGNKTDHETEVLATQATSLPEAIVTAIAKAKGWD